MKARFDTLIISSFLVLFAQQANAELLPPAMNFESQTPVWGAEQIPITWGDCIPVPVLPMGMPYNMSSGNAPMMAPPAFMPSPFPSQGVMPMMGPFDAPVVLPPPSPFFNAEKQTPVAPAQPVCDNSSEISLKKLQTRYKQAAAASKTKIEELKQALDDTQNQMTDAREVINAFSKEQEVNKLVVPSKEEKETVNTMALEDANNQLADARKIIDKLSKGQELQNAEMLRFKMLQDNQEKNRISLHQELEAAKNNIAEKTKRLSIVSILTDKAKQKTSDSNLALEDAKKQIADAKIKIDKLSKEKEKHGAEVTRLKALQNNQESNRISLHQELEATRKNTAKQAEDLNRLNLLAKEASALKMANIEHLTENKLLQNKLVSLENSNKSLNSKMSATNTEASAQARKITVLNQSAAELVALQSTYKERNDENTKLKKELASLNAKLESLQTANTLKDTQDKNIIDELNKKLTSLDDINKSFKTQLATAESDAGNQARKLTVLGQSAAELTSLQSAYKARNDENAELKKKLVAFDNTNKSLKTKLGSVEVNAGTQARKLTALGQSATELTALKSAYKERNDETVTLKKQLADFEKGKTSLNAKLDSLQTASTLKSAQDKNTIDDLKKKLASLDGANKTFKTQLASAQMDAGSQARKLTALNQSAVEFKALQSAYKMRNDENSELKKELGQLKGSMEEAVNTCKSNAEDLQKKMTDSENNSKSLLAKIVTLESTSSDQARKITAFSASAKELTALKSAYKELSSKKVELTSKLTAATADGDKDGILDSSDSCPSTPEGEEVNSLGCFADIDKDGVADSKDKCPASPNGSDVNAKGCPKIADADGDEVADANDLCPDTATGEKVNDFGCTASENITLKGVTFATGSARLKANSLPVITAAAETLKKSPNLKIEIAGYTDNQGFDYVNKRLSQRRANTVMIQLIKEGIEANRLSAKGYGEKNPIASNDAEEGRATNRRVELKIIP